MKSVMKIFEKIAKDIPRCSGDANAMMDFIENFAKAEDYTVLTDKVGNILCQKESPNVVKLDNNQQRHNYFPPQ